MRSSVKGFLVGYVALVLHIRRKADSDDDGLTDDLEKANLTHPIMWYTDGDAFTDHEELLIYGTDPVLSDTDLDMLRDDLEGGYGTDPLDPAWTATVC